MVQIPFRSFDGSDISPKEWLRVWSLDRDELVYRELVDLGRRNALSPADLERIGRWKDNAWTDGKWKPDVAMVAFKVWKRAASEPPTRPDETGAAEFLRKWLEASYTDRRKSGATVKKRFGLARATTLLHFVSGGRYPIFDARVRAAVKHLLGCPVPNTVDWYLDRFCPLISRDRHRLRN